MTPRAIGQTERMEWLIAVYRRSPTDVSKRLDRLIADIRARFHGKVMGKKSEDERMKGDVLVVAHGHILRAFAMRWIGQGLTEGVSLLLEGKLVLWSYRKGILY